MSMVWSWLNPNASACARSFSAPSVRPRLPNAVLHDVIRACSSVTRVPPQLVELPMEWLEFGNASELGESTMESGTSPSSSAAAAVTSLNVDPGGYTSRVPRFFSGSSSAFSSSSQASRWAARSTVDSRFGSKVGVETSARISPVV